MHDYLGFAKGEAAAAVALASMFFAAGYVAENATEFSYSPYATEAGVAAAGMALVGFGAAALRDYAEYRRRRLDSG